MIRIVFKIIGGFLLFFAAASLCVGIFTVVDPIHRSALRVSLPTFIVRTAIGALGFTVLGLGLLLLRKWAALILSILLFYPAYWSLISAVHPVNLVPGEWNWVGYIQAVLLIIPLVLTAMGWHVLVWCKKKVVAAQ
jgi:hypothetical protein